jgi:hypothetical protein
MSALEASRARERRLEQRVAERSAQDIGMLLGEARAHGITALDAIRDALTEKPSLPPLPALA